MDVRMRLLREEDLAQVMEWRMRPDITRFLNTDPVLTLEGQRAWYKRLQNDQTQQHWIIELEGEAIGLLQIMDIDTVDRRCSWGYYIAVQEKRSLKLATYLEWNLYDYVFDTLGLNKLCNETFAENQQVVRLHQLCGGREDGVLRAHIYKNGEYHDVSVGSILAEEWREKRKTVQYDPFVFEERSFKPTPRIDHIGYLTSDIDRSAALFETLGFWAQTDTITDDKPSPDTPNLPPRNVDLCFLNNGSCTVELVSPLSEDSVVSKTLAKQGEGPYHLCFRADDLDGYIAQLQADRWVLVHRPAEAVAFGGRRVAFLYKKHVGFIEVLETAKKAESV